MTETDKPTLSTGKYTVEINQGAAQIWSVDEENNKVWVASTTDPDKAMEIVEGLVLVEMKRFYHPESSPKIFTEEKNNKPPFIKTNLKKDS